MKSTNDPILDLQALCRERPRSEEELLTELTAFGWHPSMQNMAFRAAVGTYIEQRPDGLYGPRDGNVREVVEKTLKDGGAGT